MDSQNHSHGHGHHGEKQSHHLTLFDVARHELKKHHIPIHSNDDIYHKLNEMMAAHGHKRANLDGRTRINDHMLPKEWNHVDPHSIMEQHEKKLHHTEKTHPGQHESRRDSEHRPPFPRYNHAPYYPDWSQSYVPGRRAYNPQGQQAFDYGRQAYNPQVPPAYVPGRQVYNPQLPPGYDLARQNYNPQLQPGYDYRRQSGNWIDDLAAGAAGNVMANGMGRAPYGGYPDYMTSNNPYQDALGTLNGWGDFGDTSVWAGRGAQDYWDEPSSYSSNIGNGGAPWRAGYGGVANGYFHR
jgi:hypothetical protein